MIRKPGLGAVAAGGSARAPISGDYERSIDGFIEQLRSRSFMSLEWAHEVYEGAGHMDVPIRSLPYRLDFLFPGIVQDR